MVSDQLLRYLQDGKAREKASWTPVPRYRARPCTVVTLDCGHIRTTSYHAGAFIGVTGAEAICCIPDCRPIWPGMRYVTAAGIIR